MSNARTGFVDASQADVTVLRGCTVAVLGYGNLGRSIALNLRDSGVPVIVGAVDGPHRQLAERDGMTVTDILAATRRADLAFMLLPDEVIGDVYASHVEPGLRRGAAICLASGYALAFGLIHPREDVDVLLLAPRMLGSEVRRTYEAGGGFVSYVSVERDASGHAQALLLALAAASGSLRRGALWLRAEHEAVLDLFIEQTVGPYLGVVIQQAFEVGSRRGLPPEALVLEMYMSGEMARVFASFAAVGFMRSAALHGTVAEYGGFLQTMSIDMGAINQAFEKVFDSLASGTFATQLQEERAAGYPTLEVIRQMTSGADPMSQAEERVWAALSADER